MTKLLKNLFDVQISRILASLPTLRQSTTFTYLHSLVTFRSLWQILYPLITTQQNTAKKILIKEKHSDMEEF